jgi:gas vesicle protein GvpL/GvpF
MAWYVFALVDAIPTGTAGKGLTGPLSIRRLAGGFAVVERRADVPPVEFGSLKKHQDVVSRLATRVPAILPVRFGTLLETEHLEEAAHERDREIAEAFDLVRGRVQFTWRVRGGKAKAGGRTLEPGRVAVGATSGADYLRRAARAANPQPPAAFGTLVTNLSPLTAGRRYQSGTAAIPEAVYHLVEKADVDRYVAAAAAMRETSPALSVTGPFPPFAFAPEIL